MKTIIAFLFITLGVFGQKIEKPYPTQIESEIWLTKFRTLQSDAEKIIEIKNKIYSDTLFYNYKKSILLDNPKNPEKHICKVLFKLKFNDKYYDIDVAARKAAESQIRSKEIELKRPLTPEEANAYYEAAKKGAEELKAKQGESAICGDGNCAGAGASLRY